MVAQQLTQQQHYVQYTTAAVCTEQQTATSNLRMRQTVIDSFIYFTNAILLLSFVNIKFKSFQNTRTKVFKEFLLKYVFTRNSNF